MLTYILLLLRSAAYLKSYEYSKTNLRLPSYEELISIQSEVSSWEEHVQEKYVKESISEQLIHMFSKLYTAELSEGIEESSQLSNSNHSSPSNCDFSVEVKTSTLPNAGKGLFLSVEKGFSEETAEVGSIIPIGTVVALFPGIVHTGFDFRKPSHLDSLLPDPSFMLMSRYDGCIIDSRTLSSVPSNPYAFAHKVNHCGADRRPNTLAVIVFCLNYNFIYFYFYFKF